MPMLADFFKDLAEFYSLPFVTRPLIVGALVALCAALLGINLVLKRYSMIGDGLSHVGFGTLGISAALGFASPLILSVPLALIAAFGLLWLNNNSKLKGDSAIAIVSSSALAIGYVVISKTKGLNSDLDSYLFGSITAVKTLDFYIGVIVSAAVLILYVFFYNRIFSATCDEAFARATGAKTKLHNAFLATSTAVIVVIGIRLMGAMLVSSLIVFPALTSMRVMKSFKATAICSAALSLICFFIGITGSYIFDVSAGASVVIANLTAFMLFSVISAINKLKTRE